MLHKIQTFSVFVRLSAVVEWRRVLWLPDKCKDINRKTSNIRLQNMTPGPYQNCGNIFSTQHSGPKVPSSWPK